MANSFILKSNKANINFQDKPHHKGAQNIAGIEGQPNAYNVTHNLSGMMQDSREKQAVRRNQPQTERNTSSQREERKDC